MNIKKGGGEMARHKRRTLVYRFFDKSEFKGRVEKCMVCEAKFPTPPIIIGLDEHAWAVCTDCVLADTPTLIETARATLARHKHKAERLSRRGVDPEDYMDYEVWPDDFATLVEDLVRLGDVSKIINHDLAVLIAKHYTGKRGRKAA